MPGSRNMHAVRDVSSYQFAYSDEKVVSNNPNNNGSKRTVKSMLNGISMLVAIYWRKQQAVKLSTIILVANINGKAHY